MSDVDEALVRHKERREHEFEWEQIDTRSLVNFGEETAKSNPHHVVVQLFHDDTHPPTFE